MQHEGLYDPPDASSFFLIDKRDRRKQSKRNWVACMIRETYHRSLISQVRGWLSANRLRLFALGLALAAASPAWAWEPQPCDASTLAVVGKFLGRQDILPWTEDNQQGSAVIGAACKPWPDDAHLAVVAVAYWPNGSAPPEGTDATDALLVGMVDTSSGKLLHSYQTTIEEDAMTVLAENSLWIDTARYLLAPEVRAFGVVISSADRGPSCPDSGYEHELTLFVPDGEKLRPVFDTYLSLWQAIGNDPKCPPVNSESATLTIGIGKGSSHGFADLVVTAQRQVDRSNDDGSDEKVQSKTVRKTVQYDGHTYPFDSIPTFWQSYTRK
jgi:hypothetical protein